ncbi:MAG: beta-glucosidase [Clostridia bacterium]|nr:beta-glucosidase [Clostridia bacterium]
MSGKNIWILIWKYARAWFLTSVIVIVFFFTATMVATQNDFLSGTIDTVLGGEGRRNVSGDPDKYNRFTKTTEGFAQFQTDMKLGEGVLASAKEKETVLTEANRLNEEIVGEGVVLLKNKGEKDNKALPLAKNSKISVFGKNSANIVLGGSGSGGGNSDNTVSLYEGLRNAKFELNPELVKFYEGNSSGSGRDKNPAIGAKVTGLAIGETPLEMYNSTVKNSYEKYSDAAVVVFSRIGGEGFDLPRLQVTNYGGSPVAGSKNGGQHYLELDKNEEALLKDVIDCGKFKKVIVLINCATSMELGFVEETDGVDAALWIGSPGGSGANAIGKILNGDITPSGHLVDTYVRDFTQDPTWQNFGDNLEDGGNSYLAAGSKTGNYYVEYEEGIYLGYRYYETRSFQDIYRFGDDNGWYNQSVVYPFGYGNSYADFKWTLVESKTTPSGQEIDKDVNNKIQVTVNVKNESTKYSGKDVIQLYFSAPYIANGIEKAHVVLGGIVKTDLLAPGEDRDYTVTLDIEDMASYDYTDANGNGFKGYELDQGTYTVYIGKNAHDCWAGDNVISLEYTLFDGITYPMDIYGAGDGTDNRFESMSVYMDGKTMSRSGFKATFPQTPTKAEREMPDSLSTQLNFNYDDTNGNYVAAFEGESVQQGKKGEAPQLYEMIGLDYDDEKWDELLDYLTVDDMVTLVGQGNFHTVSIDKIGKPRTIDPDGPAGYTNFMGDPTVHDTCFYASECLIGATFNKDLANDMGIMVGLESLVGYTNGDGRSYAGWYAPAVNIHRSPFSGRNWEYYSEDPFLAGYMGTNVVIGAQSKGVYTYVKHFVLNDQETNRDSNGLITWADEQTFREIYLKPFRMIVEQGKTNAIMSSFNRIGAEWAGGSYALLTEVLRKEWGFKGMVISDYNLSNAYMHPDQMIRAGGDLNLSQDYKPSSAATQDGMTDELQIKALRQATKNILYTVANSNAMNGMGEGVVWVATMAKWKVALICVNVGFVVLSSVWGFFAIRKGFKKMKNSDQA